MQIALFLIVPVVAMVLILASGKRAAKFIALVSSLLLIGFTGWWMVFQQQESLGINLYWVESSGLRFHLAADGISRVLILLTALLYPFIIASTLHSEYKNPKVFYSLMMLMQFGLFGVFLAKDALLFYIFYEVTLIPVYFICAMWGGQGSIPITLKFFIYTLAGSLFMLVAILYLYFKTPAPHSFSIEAFYFLSLSAREQTLVYWAFFFAFAVKIPIFPFHTWQPDTYTVAPAAGTMLLAGIMLKMGIYGLIRFVIPIVPLAVEQWSMLTISLCIIGVVYASLIALRQNNLKTLIAYSSIAHVGLIAAGVLTGNQTGMQGAVIQMLNHGINVVAMFFMIDILEQRYKSKMMNELSGVGGQMKKLSWMFFIVLLGSIGLPLTNGFIGEFLLLKGIYEYHPLMAAIAGTSLILGAAYMLRLYRNVFLGDVSNFKNENGDTTKQEVWILLPLCILIVVIGVYPSPLLELSEKSISSIIQIFQGGLAAGL